MPLRPCLAPVLVLFACVVDDPPADTTDSGAGATATADDSDGGTPTDGGADASTFGSDVSTSAGGDTSTATSDGASTTGTTDMADGSSGGSSGGPPPDCAASSDCEACGELAGCGWCGATGTCHAGDATGPAAGACSGGWVVEGDFFSCPAANCFGRTSCTDCQDAFTGCGWCASTNSCMAGAPDMPASPAVCADQQWFFDICPEDCASEMTCVSCTSTVGCGWCGATNSCTAGTDAGPLVGACAAGWSTEVDPCF